MKAAMRQMKNAVMAYEPVEVLVREATSSDPWGASSTLMAEIADASYDPHQYSKLLGMLWKRLQDYQHHLHVQKALLLIESLLRNGSDRFVNDCKRRAHDINKIRRYKYYNRENVDIALDVRKKAKMIYELLSDSARLQEERDKAKNIRSIREQHVSNESYGSNRSGRAVAAGSGRGSHAGSGRGHRQPPPPNTAPPGSGSGRHHHHTQPPRSNNSQNYGSGRGGSGSGRGGGGGVVDKYDLYSNTSRVLAEEERRTAAPSSNERRHHHHHHQQQQAPRSQERTTAKVVVPSGGGGGDDPFGPVSDPFAATDAVAPQKDKKKKKKKTKKGGGGGGGDNNSNDPFGALEANPFDDAPADDPFAGKKSAADAFLASALTNEVTPAPASAGGRSEPEVDFLTGAMGNAAVGGGDWENAFEPDHSEHGRVEWGPDADNDDDDDDDDDDDNNDNDERKKDPFNLVDLDQLHVPAQPAAKTKRKSATMADMKKTRPSIIALDPIAGFAPAPQANTVPHAHAMDPFAMLNQPSAAAVAPSPFSPMHHQQPVQPNSPWDTFGAGSQQPIARQNSFSGPVGGGGAHDFGFPAAAPVPHAQPQPAASLDVFFGSGGGGGGGNSRGSGSNDPKASRRTSNPALDPFAGLM